MWVCTVLQTLLQPRAEVEQLLSRLAFAGNEPLFLTYGSCETALVSKKVQPGCNTGTHVKHHVTGMGSFDNAQSNGKAPVCQQRYPMGFGGTRTGAPGQW